MGKTMFVVGFIVDCTDLRNNAKFTDHTAKVAPKLRTENYERMEEEIRNDYNPLGYCIEYIKKEKVYEFNPLDLIDYIQKSEDVKYDDTVKQ